MRNPTRPRKLARAQRRLRDLTVELRERTKELRCLYAISKICEKPGLPLSRMLQRTVDLMPASWQHPDIARSRGLGWCELKVDWSNSQWLARANLAEGLFPDDPLSPSARLEDDGLTKAQEWLNAFLRVIGLEGNDNE